MILRSLVNFNLEVPNRYMKGHILMYIFFIDKNYIRKNRKCVKLKWFAFIFDLFVINRCRLNYNNLTNGTKPEVQTLSINC